MFAWLLWWVCLYATAERRLEINKYWLVGVRYGHVGLPTLTSTLGDMTETITDIPLAVKQPSYIGNGDFAEPRHIHSSQLWMGDGGVLTSVDH